MSTTHIATVEGMECHVFTTGSPFGTHASGMAFDGDARTVANIDSVMYAGYCLACIIALTIERMELGFPIEGVVHDVAMSGHECQCAELEDDTPDTPDTDPNGGA